MPEFGTIGHLIELAIQGEKLAEAFYLRLEKKFSRYPDVAQFWNSYASEENGHARWLARLRERVGEDRLNQPAEPEVLQQAERALATPIEPLLAGIRTLQDAYNTANELEHSETNTVFEFLISHFAEDAQSHAFLREQLNEHVGRLMIDFPKQLGTGSLRRGIPAEEE
jgi:rubrerythrin